METIIEQKNTSKTKLKQVKSTLILREKFLIILLYNNFKNTPSPTNNQLKITNLDVTSKEPQA